MPASWSPAGHPGHLTEAALPGRALPGIYRLDGHLAALLVVERRAFWPLMFADPTQQPLEARAPHAGISQPIAEPVEWSVLSQDHFSDDTLGNARYLTNWRANFDQVLLIDPSPPVSLPRDSPAGSHHALCHSLMTSSPRADVGYETSGERLPCCALWIEDGTIPKYFRNTRLKCDELEKPHENATSVDCFSAVGLQFLTAVLQPCPPNVVADGHAPVTE